MLNKQHNVPKARARDWPTANVQEVMMKTKTEAHEGQRDEFTSAWLFLSGVVQAAPKRPGVMLISINILRGGGGGRRTGEA